MKTFFVAAFIICMAVLSFGQTSLREGPKVNDVGLGATREQVLAKFGKPRAETKKQADECVGGTEITLEYPGLKFKLWDDVEDARKFTVGWIEIRSDQWNVSGIKVGDTTAVVRKQFGVRTSQETNRRTGNLIWFYEMDDDSSPGNTSFTFRNGKLTLITTLWMMC